MDPSSFSPEHNLKLTSRLSVFSVCVLREPTQKQLLSSAEDYRNVNLRNSKPTKYTTD